MEMNQTVYAAWMVQSVAWLYVGVNTARVFFYLPQLRALFKVRGSAAGVSSLTWAAFSLSHFTALLYAVVVLDDWMLAMISSLNLIFSFAIFVVASVKQAPVTRRRAMMRRALPVLRFFRLR